MPRRHSVEEMARMSRRMSGRRCPPWRPLPCGMGRMWMGWWNRTRMIANSTILWLEWMSLREVIGASVLWGFGEAVWKSGQGALEVGISKRCQGTLILRWWGGYTSWLGKKMFIWWTARFLEANVRCLSKRLDYRRRCGMWSCVSNPCMDTRCWVFAWRPPCSANAHPSWCCASHVVRSWCREPVEVKYIYLGLSMTFYSLWVL